MSEKNIPKYNPKTAFDDSKLPINNLSTKRQLEIEKSGTPHFQEALEKLKQEKPHLFKEGSSVISK